MTDTIARALGDSVQSRPKADEGISVLRLDAVRGPVLPPYGTRTRLQALKRWYRHEYSWAIQGTIAGIISRYQSTQFTIRGPEKGPNNAHHFQTVFREAEFGAGWDELWSKVWLDFFRYDIGGFIEVIGPGRADGPITGKITGLAHLDAMRCYPTGDPEFPVIYMNSKGKRHKMHHTRVQQYVDMPDGDVGIPGWGLCALSRAISIAEQIYYMWRYARISMDEAPPPGFASLIGMTTKQFLAAVGDFEQRRDRDAPPVYGNLVLLPGLVKGTAPEVKITSYSTAPEKYDMPVWLKAMVNAIALVFKIDVQEIWELGSGGTGLGTGKQSEVLHTKTQGKMPGQMLSMATRRLNTALPPSMTFEFTPNDPYAQLDAANAAKGWADFTGSVADTMSVDERRRLLASTVPQYRDIVTNEQGQMVALTGDDQTPRGEGEVSTLTDQTPAPTNTRPPADEGQAVVPG